MNSQELQERVAKLPRWAQEYIGRLERDLESARTVQTAIKEGTTDIWWRDVLKDDANYLPSHCDVVFQTNTGVIKFSLWDGKIKIWGQPLHNLSIKPEAHNIICIEQYQLR